MTAFDARLPRDPARPLTPEIRGQLRAAVLAQWRAPERELPELAEALQAVAIDARARGLRPEDLIIALHEVQFEIGTVEARLPTDVRDRVHTWLVRACMRAYFGDRS
jgi:hypothetical protein